MKSPDLQSLSIMELSSMYEKTALTYGVAMERGNPKIANKENDMIRALERELKRRGSEGYSVGRNLMCHNAPWVRLLAAGFMLRVAPQEAEPVLRELAAPQRGDCAFIAETIIELWRNGNLPPED